MKKKEAGAVVFYEDLRGLGIVVQKGRAISFWFIVVKEEKSSVLKGKRAMIKFV